MLRFIESFKWFPLPVTEKTEKHQNKLSALLLLWVFIKKRVSQQALHQFHQEFGGRARSKESLAH